MTENHRTAYDRAQFNRLNPLAEGYNAPPFPTPRTQYDADLQARICSNCPYKNIEKYDPNPAKFRTKYDQELASTFDPQKSNDYSQSFNKAGYYSHSTPTREGFLDDGAYERAFSTAGWIKPPPSYEGFRRNVREGYPTLYDDSDNLMSYGL